MRRVLLYGLMLALPCKVTVSVAAPAALPIRQRVSVPVGPAWIETGFGSVWVSAINSRVVLRIDPSTNAIVARIPVLARPELGIGVGLGSVWVADTRRHAIIQIDPNSNAVVQRIPVVIPDETEGSMAIGEGSVWVLTNAGGTDSGTLSRIDPATRRVIADIPVGPKSHAAIAALGSIWVSSTGSDRVVRVDPGTNRVIASVAVHAAPRFLAAGEGSLWVLSQSDGSLSRIDPQTNRVVAVIAVDVPGEGGDLCVGEHYVWVSAQGVPLVQIDPESNRVVRRFVGSKGADTLRVGFGSAWMVDDPHGKIWRIDVHALDLR